MTDYIQVPVDLLSELAESLACELDARYPASVRSYESQDRKYMAEMEPVLTARRIIAAAPDHIADASKMVAADVQGEPVAWNDPVVAPDGFVLMPRDLTNEMVRAFCMATVLRWDDAPEDQKKEVAEKLQHAFDAVIAAAPQPAEPKAKTHKESWWAGYRAGKGLPANTPRQDAIDAPHVMNVLVEALRSILGWRELRSGNDFPVERIEEIARDAIAAYRKQGGK